MHCNKTSFVMRKGPYRIDNSEDPDQNAHTPWLPA